MNFRIYSYVLSVIFSICFWQYANAQNPISVSLHSEAICEGECSTLTALVTGGNLPYQYTWSIPNQTTSSIHVCPTATSAYSVTVIDANGKIATTSATITIFPKPDIHITSGNDITITSGLSTILAASGGVDYLWNTGETTKLIEVSPAVTSTFIVTGTSANGCSSHDTAVVFINPNCSLEKDAFIIPNIFTPNGDDVNDYFLITPNINTACIKNIEFEIYNRWGLKIFEGKSITDEWDGKYNGTILTSDVFFYFCKAELESGEEVKQKGNVTLFR